MGIKLTGDSTIASSYIGWAKQRLNQLKEAMKVFNVPSKSRIYSLADASIEVSSSYGEDSILITAIKAEAEFLYVADTSNHRIQKFTTSGKFVTTWGKWGTELGNFQYPYEVNFYDNKVFVSNRLAASIDIFSTTGILINRMVVANFPVGKFAKGSDTVTKNEKLAVAVSLDLSIGDMVLVYDYPALTVAYSISPLGFGETIGGVEIGGNKLFIAYTDTSAKIKVFDLVTGNLLYTLTGSKQYETIKYLDKKLYAASFSYPITTPFYPGDERIYIYDVADNGTLTINSRWGQLGNDPGQFYGWPITASSSSVRGLAVYKKSVWVSEINDTGFFARDDAARVQQFSLSGTFKLKVGKLGRSDFMVTPNIIAPVGTFNQPFGIAVGAG